jgi:hypothetical protein
MIYIATTIFESSLRDFRDSLNINIGKEAIYIEHIHTNRGLFANCRINLMILKIPEISLWFNAPCAEFSTGGLLTGCAISLIAAGFSSSETAMWTRDFFLPVVIQHRLVRICCAETLTRLLALMIRIGRDLLVGDGW